MTLIYQKYASLLVSYCLSLSKGERVLVRTTTAAEPLLPFLYEEILKKGAFPEFQIGFKSQQKTFYLHADDTHLSSPSLFYTHAIHNFDAVLTIDAPHHLHDTKDISPLLKKKHQEALSEIKKVFMRRSAAKELRWALCVFPTQALADEVGMTLDEYERFVFQACYLYSEHPEQEWISLGKRQQRYVDVLNTKTHFQFIAPGTNISFSTKGRVWINSDGKRNMPSGEVFTSPVEESVNGTIFFSYPSSYMGQDVEGVTLTVKEGLVTEWHAQVGQDVLDQVFSIPGSRCFGEAAIGTNMQIQKATKNILFDEKIGGSIHMAIGASYPETGGKNESSVHWDLITTMKDGGKILADGKCIYENGVFLF